VSSDVSVSVRREIINTYKKFIVHFTTTGKGDPGPSLTHFSSSAIQRCIQRDNHPLQTNSVIVEASLSLSSSVIVDAALSLSLMVVGT
jgi:hypothetical protein